MLDVLRSALVCCFFKQKTAYEVRISDWSSEVCSSDLPSRKYVRVNGERQGLVEFDFGVGDLTLSVEMMLSHEDFQRFCADEQVILVTAKREAAQDDEAAAMSWRPSDVQHLIEGHTSLLGEK